MSLRDQIRDLIGDFYDGEITARQFREKFAPLYYESDSYAWDIKRLFVDIDSIYAGYIMGRIDESELKKQLFEFLPSTRMQFAAPAITNFTEFASLPTGTGNHSPRLSPQSTRTKSQSNKVVLTQTSSR
jgi:hypothetical protein